MKANLKKQVLLFLVVLLIGGLGYGIYYISTLAPVITGYAAKNLASGVFVGNRTQESMEQNDLNFSFIKYNKNTVDFQNKEVISRFLWFSSKAVYVEGFGCTLLRDVDQETIKSRKFPTIEPDTIDASLTPWPAGDLLSDTLPKGINIEILNRALDSAFSNNVGSKGTYAVAVSYKNQLISERYQNGFTSKNRFLSWSMAKSFTNAIAGIMVKKGMLNIDEQVELQGRENTTGITFRNLMNMNSGLEWNEDYGNLSDVTLMLYKEKDMGTFSWTKKPLQKPDSVWYYSSGTTNIACKYIRQKFNSDDEYFKFPYTELFNKTGMRSIVWETDATGTLLGSSYLYASLRDYVRFGLLYLNNGVWFGNRILPENWVNISTTEVKGSNGKYGAFFWLNKSKSYPNVPDDMYFCQGHDGQFIYIIPSLKLVVVRVGFSKKGEFNAQKFLENVVKAVEN